MPLRLFGLSVLALIFGGMTLFVLRDHSRLRKPYDKHVFYLTSRLSHGMYLNHFPVFSFGVPLPAAARGVMVIAVATFIVIESRF
jgi:peptidoglycan/LPS O-acetylase OafA/YrhL